MDDEQLILNTSIRAAKKVFPNAEIKGFTDPRELIKEAAEHMCDLLITDVNMPYFNGVTVAKALRTLDSNVKVIFQTGDERNAEYIAEIQNSGLLLKPYREDDLLEQFEYIDYKTKKAESKQTDLFEVIRNKIECEYISDIRIGKNRNNAIKTANQINPEDFGLNQWSVLANYLCKKHTSFRDYGQVKEYFAKKSAMIY